MSSTWRIAPWLACFLSLGCFADPGTTPCPEGSEGCACVELQCEAGLTCSGGVCMAMATGTGTEPDPTTSTTVVPGTSSTTDDSADGSSTTAETMDDTTSTGEVLCGNGVLDPDEMCDGTNACTDECELENYPCNPYNDVGCGPDQKCSFIEPTTILCLGAAAEVGGFGYNECFYDGSPHDESCETGLVCIPFQITNTCDGGGCCVEYCDLGDPTFECTTPGNTCVPAYGVPPFEPGLEWLGFCGT